MDTTAILQEAEKQGKLAFTEFVGSLQNEWDNLPLNVKEQAKNAIQRLAQAKALRLAGLSSASVLTADDERIMLSLLDDVNVYGKLTLKQLAISAVDNVLMKALEMAGSVLRRLIGL